MGNLIPKGCLIFALILTIIGIASVIYLTVKLIQNV